MHAGKNIGIMTTLKKNLLQKGTQGGAHTAGGKGRLFCLYSAHLARPWHPRGAVMGSRARASTDERLSWGSNAPCTRQSSGAPSAR
jgi:hypothetical protein